MAVLVKLTLVFLGLLVVSAMAEGIHMKKEYDLYVKRGYRLFEAFMFAASSIFMTALLWQIGIIFLVASIFWIYREIFVEIKAAEVIKACFEKKQTIMTPVGPFVADEHGVLTPLPQMMSFCIRIEFRP